jgi:hypothetical protein
MNEREFHRRRAYLLKDIREGEAHLKALYQPSSIEIINKSLFDKSDYANMVNVTERKLEALYNTLNQFDQDNARHLKRTRLGGLTVDD